MALVHGRANGEARELQLDDWSWKLTIIDATHVEIHEGNTYVVSYYDDDVADDGTVEILLRVGDEPAHATFGGQAGGDAVAYLIENPTVNAAGTALTEFNKNRISANTATLTAFHTPTVVGGTALLTLFMPGGSGPQAGGTQASSGGEWILKPNEDYVARITNISGQAQEISIDIEWYEEASH